MSKGEIKMNGDLGADAGTASINLMAKASEALLEALKSLIKGLYQIYKDNPQRKLDAVKLKEAKTQDEKLRIIKKMQGIDGYISAKKLEKYCNAIGSAVIPRNMEFESQEQRDLFCNIAKEQHLMFSMTEDKNNPLKTTVLIADKDMDILKRCKEMTEDSIKIEIIDQKIDSIMYGREYEQLSEDEKFKVDVLNAEKASINDKWTNNFNQNTYSNVVDDILNASHGEKNYEADRIDFDYETFTNDTYNKKDAFASALDSDVFKSLNKDRYSVVVSAVDPQKYVICHSTNNPDKDAKRKINTEYQVFNSNGESRVFRDANLSPKEWVAVREEMRDFCEIGGENVLRFNSVKAFENWKKLVEEQNRIEDVRSLADSELKDGIGKRQEELKEKGFDFRDDGEIYCISHNNSNLDAMIMDDDEISDTPPNDAYHYDPVGKNAKDIIREIDGELNNRKLSPLEKVELQKLRAEMVEGILIAREITNYESLIKTNDDLAIVKSNLAIAEINNDEEKIASVKEDIAELTHRHDTLSSEKDSIVGQRSEINSVQANLECERLKIEYSFSKDELKTLNQLGKDAERVGYVPRGKGNEFVEEIRNMEYKQAIYKLAKLSVDVGDACLAEKANGENITDLTKFRTDLTKFQNNMISNVKRVEPNVFYKYANLELKGKSLELANKLGEKYEQMNIGSKDDFVENIKSVHGANRQDALYSLRLEMLAVTEATDAEKDSIYELFAELERREFELDHKANETFVANIGDAYEENAKEQSFDEYEKDINDRKENASNSFGEKGKGDKNKEFNAEKGKKNAER